MSIAPQPLRAVILGAGRPARGDVPAALLGAGQHGRVLDWQLRTWAVAAAEVVFVGGYRATEIAARYPDLHLVLNPRWQHGGPVGSLLRALPASGQGCFVAYADTLFREALVLAVSRNDDVTAVAIDTQWRQRYDGRSSRDIEQAQTVCALPLPDGWRFTSAHGCHGPAPPSPPQGELVGLVRLSPRAVAWLASRRDDEALSQWDLPALLNALAARGEPLHLVDVQGDWAELDAAQDLARFVLGTKAETLARLRPMVRASHIGDVLALRAGQWRADAPACLQLIAQRFGAAALAVRSSALGEDGFNQSAAGRYRSVLDVEGRDPAQVASAIDQVLASYANDDPLQQVLVQPMLRNVALAGVVMTRTLSHGAPYRVINFESGSGRSDAVTGGRTAGLKTWVLHHQVPTIPKGAPQGLQPLLSAVREIESLVGHDSLDIEFVVDAQQRVHVLQVRPIAMRRTQWVGSDPQVAAALQAAQRDFVARQRPQPGVAGTTSVFSRMSDWNPAEMIGSRPQRLALDLYDHLIMRETWAAQRAGYGYRDLRPHPLMVVFAGHAYVDVRASLNSFIPAQVDDELAARLVDHQVQALQRQPELHDKLEFEIAITCLAPDVDEPLRRLQAGGFSRHDCELLRTALVALTAGGCARIDQDLRLARPLFARQEALRAAGLPPLRLALSLLADARPHGCLPFAHLARAAFVATAWLRGARGCGLLTRDEERDFLGSVHTVASAFRDDSHRLGTGLLAPGDFLARYGHLRPGTYDIRVPSYADDPQRYRLIAPAKGDPPPAAGDLAQFWASIDPASGVAAALAQDHGSWTAASRQRLADALARAGLDIPPLQMESFMRLAIAGREWAKFNFSRSLSWALDAVSQFGREIGVDAQFLSCLSLAELEAADSGQLGAKVRARWQRCVEAEGLAHELALGIELPPLLARSEQFHAFEQPESLPNFVGLGMASGPVVSVDAQHGTGLPLCGAIALAQHADPGYDWLFGQGIAGLVTAYGGANSHMAVRAAELGLPAAIGVGEALLERLAQARRLRVDTELRLVQVER